MFCRKTSEISLKEKRSIDLTHRQCGIFQVKVNMTCNDVLFELSASPVCCDLHRSPMSDHADHNPALTQVKTPGLSPVEHLWEPNTRILTCNDT